MGKNPFINPLKPASYQFGTGIIGLDSLETASATVTRSELLYSGFQSGETIYVAAYAATTPSEPYMDTVAKKWIYTGFSPYHSEVKSFILP